MCLVVMIRNNVIAMDRPATTSRTRRAVVAAVFALLGLVALAAGIGSLPDLRSSSAGRLIVWVMPS